MQLMVFSKHLAGPPLADVARGLSAIGIAAIDLTVRPAGHVDPARVQDDLPRATEDLAAHGVRIGHITTGITGADEAHASAILETAAALGVRHFKLGYYGYRGFGTLRQARDEACAQMRDLAAMCREVGLTGGFHNHSENFLGACLHDIDFVLDGISPREIGLYFDAAHASIEGGSSGWEMGLDLMRDSVVALAVKDYKWADAMAQPPERGYGGGRRWKVRWCPLDAGNVPWPQVLARLHSVGFSGPIWLHSEYQGPHSFRDLESDEVFEQTARDAEIFVPWARAAGFDT